MTADRKPTPPPLAPAPAGRGRRDNDPITMGLRRLWADVESEEVPDDFLSLLDEIDSKRAGGGPDEAGGATGRDDMGRDDMERP